MQNKSKTKHNRALKIKKNGVTQRYMSLNIEVLVAQQ